MLKQFRDEANEPCPGPRFLGWLNTTPFMSEIELKFAGQLIKAEHLGSGPGTDMRADHGASPNPRDIRQHHLNENRPLTSLVGNAVARALSRAFGQGKWIQDF